MAIVYVDLDNTICYFFKNEDGDWDYSLSKPRHEQIKKINKLYMEGNEVVYWTARGSKTGMNWRELTIKRLNDWVCKYTRISKIKKPVYD